MSDKSDNWMALLEDDELLALSRYDIENGRLDKALLKLKRLISGKEPPAEAISMAARLYAQLKLFDRAEALFRRYLDIDSEAVTEMFQLGMTLFDGGKPVEALAVWDQVLSRQAYYPPALFFKALVLARNGDVDASRMQLDELLRRIPADNLYFSRAHDLLREIGGQQVNTSSEKNFDTLIGMDNDAYKTIQ
jgi:tetratricopeptide (TPR) repeat protein